VVVLGAVFVVFLRFRGWNPFFSLGNGSSWVLACASQCIAFGLLVGDRSEGRPVQEGDGTRQAR